MSERIQTVRERLTEEERNILCATLSDALGAAKSEGDSPKMEYLRTKLGALHARLSGTGKVVEVTRIVT